MTLEVNIHQAKTHLSRLLQRVMLGEEVVIANAGKPVARLVPYGPPPGPRVPGQDAGLVWIEPDFDDPLPDDIVALFEGKDDDAIRD
jgi:prevent-host-death family protein